MVMQQQQPTQHETLPRKAYHVRSYQPADHAAVLGIFVAGIRQYPVNVAQLQPEWQRLIQDATDGDFADIRETYFATGGHFWVATCERQADAGEEVVGMVALKADRDAGGAELLRMFVHPAYHRCGIGRLLVNTLEQWATDESFTRVWLATPKIALNAHRFYESTGYTFYHTKMLPVGVEVRYYEKYLACSTQ